MRWNLRRGSNPLSGDLGSILDFLAHLLSIGKAYSTINIARSMLSTTLGPVEGFAIGSHPLVVRFMKGCYNRNPPKPRYNSTWDPELVLNFIKSLGSDESLSLSDLSSKLACLVALTTLLRVSDLAGIDYETINIDPPDASFSLSRPMKAQHSGPLKRVLLKVHEPDTLVCPVACLQNYLTRTDPFRSGPRCKRLFLGLISPHDPVSSESISRWIKSVLSRSGIDTSIYAAHSTRGAASSAAVRAGVSIDTVLRAGNWSRQSTFERFYYRP